MPRLHLSSPTFLDAVPVATGDQNLSLINGISRLIWFCSLSRWHLAVSLDHGDDARAKLSASYDEQLKENQKGQNDATHRQTGFLSRSWGNQRS